MKYRQLWNWGKPNQPESVYVEPALSETATVSEVGLVEPEQDEPDQNNWSDSRGAREPTETAAPPPTAPTVDEISSLNEAEKQELYTQEKQIKQALAIPKRLWYEVGKALVRVRDTRLYRESHSDFHKYCLERFNKTRRHIDRWITAAAARDNLASEGCKVLPLAESVHWPIASLPPSQQVEVWNRAVEAVVGCPTAAKVEEIRDVLRGKTLPQPIENEQAELDPSVQTNWSKSSALESRSQAKARDWILLLDLTEMESLHLWLGELIQSLRKVSD